MLAGRAAEQLGVSHVTSMAHLKPTHRGTREIPPPPPKKSCLDKVRNSLARKIRTDHWRSAVYLKRIKKRPDGKCWFCHGRFRMTRSHVLLHCPGPVLAAARVKAWEGRDPESIRVLLSNPRWERRLVRFLELSGVGRRMADGTDEDETQATREWITREAEETGEGGDRLNLFPFCFPLC